jgi:cation diffusion facilitator family transporter
VPGECKEKMTILRHGRSLREPKDGPGHYNSFTALLQHQGDRHVRIEEHYRASRKAAAWGAGVSLTLGIAKVLGGYFGHSIALLSDSVNSLGDALVSGIIFLALGWSQLPADKEHPYGHTRMEAALGSNVALLLICSAIAIIVHALWTLRTPSPTPELYTLVIAAFSVVLKEGLFRYHHAVAERTGSGAVRAAAWDHRSDALSSLAVLIALGIIELGGQSFHVVDHLGAIVVGLCVGWAGTALFWRSVQELLDRQAEPEILESVRREALTVSGVQNVEKLFVRKSGIEYLADIHVEVDPRLSVRDSHAIAHAVKDRVRFSIVQIKDVLVHIEPGITKDET